MQYGQESRVHMVQRIRFVARLSLCLEQAQVNQAQLLLVAMLEMMQTQSHPP